MCDICGKKTKCDCQSNVPGPIGLTGPPGPMGQIGAIPAHEWNGTQIRFQNPDGSFGPWVNLQGSGGSGTVGPPGPQGIQGPAGGSGPAGAPGPQGDPGTPGAIGPIGPTGADGAPGGTLPWQILNNAGGSTENPLANNGYISYNTHPTNPTIFSLPLTANIGDKIEIECAAGIASATIGISSRIMFNMSSGFFADSTSEFYIATPATFQISVGESMSFIYIGSTPDFTQVWMMKIFTLSTGFNTNPSDRLV